MADLRFVMIEVRNVTPELVERVMQQAMGVVHPQAMVLTASPGTAPVAEAREVVARRPTAAARSEPTAEAGDEPKSLADRIQEHIELRGGALSTSRIAQLLGGSEHGVRVSMSMSKGRFEINDNDEWVVKEQE